MSAAKTALARGRRSSTTSWYHAALLRAAPLLLGVIASCGPPPAPQAPSEPAPAPAPRPAPRQPWPAFAEVTAWPALNATRFRTKGHLVEPSFAEVRINDDARELYLNLVTDSVLPEGTVVSLFFSDEPGTLPGPIYVMEKAGSGWRYFATDEQGGVDPSVDAELCARCHEGAPADGLFGLPQGTPVAAPGRPTEN